MGFVRSGDGRVVPTNQSARGDRQGSHRGSLSSATWLKHLKATVKGYKNRLAHLTRSREQWRIRAEREGEQITTLEVEIAELTTDCCGPGWRRWGGGQ